MLWDVFCHVIDHYGDLGVCWRLSAQLADRGDTVRLWVDDATPLIWMAPSGHAGVSVHPWNEPTSWPEPGDVVIEAFGCALPEAFVHGMRARQAQGRASRWINLEYLSAESYVERSHGLLSPQLTGAARGLEKKFYYPGFTSATGGLLRETDLLQRQARFDAATWLTTQGIHPVAGERRVSLFCYEHAPLADWLHALAQQPTLLLATHGAVARRVQDILGPGLRLGALRAVLLPPLTQLDFDHLLWSCDLNIVRGEDSFVRAQWAGQPFLWHIYAQDDHAHARKLQAFHALFLQEAEPAWAAQFINASYGCNGLLAEATLALPVMAAWHQHCVRWRDHLWAQEDVVSGLQRWAHGGPQLQG